MIIWSLFLIFITNLFPASLDCTGAISTINMVRELCSDWHIFWLFFLLFMAAHSHYTVQILCAGRLHIISPFLLRLNWIEQVPPTIDLLSAWGQGDLLLLSLIPHGLILLKQKLRSCFWSWISESSFRSSEELWILHCSWHWAILNFWNQYFKYKTILFDIHVHVSNSRFYAFGVIMG